MIKPRDALNKLKPYTPGENPKKPGIIKLASNENPFGPSPKALEAIKKEASRLQTYPDQKSALLREALAKKLGLTKEHIMIGNGSDEIMQLLAEAFLNAGEEVVVPKNAFGIYEMVAKLFDGQAIYAPLKDQRLDLGAFSALLTERTKLIFLCNPLNPCGTYFTQSELDAFLKKVPDKTLVVIDEAYIEFSEAQDLPQTLPLINTRENIVVLRTFSKFYGLAGLRAGYALAHPKLISYLFMVKMPFNVSRLAQAGALAALEDQAFADKTYKNNLEGKRYLYSELDKLGLNYKKTESNFIFIEVGREADGLFLEMLGQEVIIRPLTSFGLPQAIRVSIGTPAQNKKFISALKKVLGK
jgi:histidinol-phosphate aminotransferase